ncbi:DUF3027 domain-containing protein [Homoserinibacter sp. YIM 151385]|uniref:DUF3027 domain-containing protein n=1 Tax=Homoserinibacter sp. YIM 151385 TaxID=2985506 RepID=UPI0022F03F6E|nr:DUF3027 domain-containing protein [Homoserinibacter sp. YIM 151385]WBU37864.1 DUF3027 domain-containing protein [Homoserinibacter sp. YIM 151385]
MPEPVSDAGSREDVARAALLEITPASTIGDFLGEEREDERVLTLRFASTMLGYPGWRWTVSVAELSGEAPTVLEAELVPGDGALLAPDWVPWSERLEEYRAAQAAAAEGDEDADDDGESDDEAPDEDDDADDTDSDDDDSDDEDGELHDHGDDVYDGIDIEHADEDADDAAAEADDESAR